MDHDQPPEGFNTKENPEAALRMEKVGLLQQLRSLEEQLSVKRERICDIELMLNEQNHEP